MDGGEKEGFWGQRGHETEKEKRGEIIKINGGGERAPRAVGAGPAEPPHGPWDGCRWRRSAPSAVFIGC